MPPTHDNRKLAKRYSQQGELFCDDLPSKSKPEMGKILVTGASGYIGGRLVPELLARGYHVRVMVRAASSVHEKRWPDAEIVVADALDLESLKAALQDVHTAYYLIHSMLLGYKKFATADLQAAVNFCKAAESANVAGIIYLGGLGDTRSQLSDHLRSRSKVAEELSSSKVPVTVLRAAVIVGSGSAPFEIIQHLVRKLVIMPIPPWAKNRCQPIAIRDVIKYLVGVLETPQAMGRHFDIGGVDILTYEQMLKIMAEILGKKRIFPHTSVSNFRFFAYCSSLLTPVPAPITLCLMEGLANEVICQNQSIKKLIPFQPLTYKQAIVKALSRQQQDRVYTRWSDAYPPAHELAVKLHELKGLPKYIASYSLTTQKSNSDLFQSICKIGGKEGWFYHNWMWRIRGAVDRFLLGVGSARGRKSSTNLEINDVIDFWRVEDIEPNKKLLLRAEMKLPGKAWIKFTIRQQGTSNILTVTALYQTHTFLGRLYWYVFLPFHHFIFVDLIKQIEKVS